MNANENEKQSAPVYFFWSADSLSPNNRAFTEQQATALEYAMKQQLTP